MATADPDLDEALHAELGVLDRRIPEDQLRRFEAYAAKIFRAFGMSLDTSATRETPRRFIRALHDVTAGYDGDSKLIKAFPTECRCEPDCRLGPAPGDLEVPSPCAAPAGRGTLRVQASVPFRLRRTGNEWERADDTDSTPTGTGAGFADIPVLTEQRAPVRFTFFWTKTGNREGRDFEVRIEPAGGVASAGPLRSLACQP